MDCLNQMYTISIRLSGRVVMQRIANPSTPVRFRPQPPKLNHKIICEIDAFILYNLENEKKIVSGGFDPVHVGHYKCLKKLNP